MIIAHVDMDCFFAACEIKKRPHLAKKPVIVGGTKESKRGVVCTANYPARAYGVHSAMPIVKATTLCPHATFLCCDHRLYKTESQKVMHILKQYTSLFVQASIDEAYLDITHLVKSKDDWMDVARIIRKSVYLSTGYTCSIGVCDSKRVSKIASGYKKPHGITCVYDKKQFLAKLPLKAIPGIGKKTLPLFARKGITTISDLASKSAADIQYAFGSNALSYWRLANGIDTSQLEESQECKSQSVENTFNDDIADVNHLLCELDDLIERLEKRVDGFFTTITLKVRYSSFHTITRSKTIPPTGSLHQTKRFFVQMVQDYVKSPVRLLGIKVDNFIGGNDQTTLVSFLANA